MQICQNYIEMTLLDSIQLKMTRKHPPIACTNADLRTTARTIMMIYQWWNNNDASFIVFIWRFIDFFFSNRCRSIIYNNICTQSFNFDRRNYQHYKLTLTICSDENLCNTRLYSFFVASIRCRSKCIVILSLCLRVRKKFVMAVIYH